MKANIVSPILRSTLALVALATPVFAQPAEPTPTEAPPAVDAPAAVPVEAPAAPAPKADDDDDILASLGLDPNAPTFDDKLQIYGFADFNYTYARFPNDVIPAARAFSVGSVNL